MTDTIESGQHVYILDRRQHFACGKDVLGGNLVATAETRAWWCVLLGILRVDRHAEWPDWRESDPRGKPNAFLDAFSAVQAVREAERLATEWEDEVRKAAELRAKEGGAP